jgi:hypothetical protein
MKLTKKKLRTLIAEEFNNVLREGGAVGHMVELTDGNATEADISEIGRASCRERV